MRHRVSLFVVLMLAAHGIAQAQSQIGVSQSQLYRLTDKSNYAFGCTGPCLCPYSFKNTINGTFQLTFTSRDSSFAYYAVTDVNWVALVQGSEIRITGSGTYKIGGDPVPTQEMQLKLNVGGTFDSGIVPESAPGFPAINLAIGTVTGCAAFGIQVAAVPVLASEILPFSLIGSKDAVGCFGPCECAVSALPVLGGFDLVKLAESNDVTTFGVVGVNWEVPKSPLPGTIGAFPISGFGIYEVFSLAGQERMVLDLTLDGKPSQRFDSGLVSGNGSLLRIDIELAASQFACFDQVFDLHAHQRHPHGRGGLTPLSPM